MSGINKVILVGYLGKDPEIRTFENGSKKASFSMATTEYRKDKDGNRIEITEWHNIVMWRNLAELAEKYLSKGRQIYVEGRLRTRNWDDANGVKHYITEVEANTFTFLRRTSSGVHTLALSAPGTGGMIQSAPVHTNTPTGSMSALTISGVASTPSLISTPRCFISCSIVSVR